MTVRSEGRTVYLEGICGVEEAETLAALLDEGADWSVDLSACERLHGAMVQALLAYRPALRGEPPQDVFFRDFLHPALASALAER